MATDGILAGQSLPPSLPKQSRQTRRYGFACSNCRRRKARCEGDGNRACRNCVVANKHCSYDKKPSVAFVVSLQHQLNTYQERFELLRGTTNNDERDALLAQPVIPENPPGGRARAPKTSHVEEPAPEERNAGRGVPVPLTDAEPDGLPEETSIGSDGQVHFYGKTSLYRIDSQESADDRRAHTCDDLSSAKNLSLASETRNDERDEMRAFLSDIEPDLLNELLDVYWCWPHHLHYFLSKKIFLRDLQILGPNVSPFLLSTVLAQAARYSMRVDATAFGDRFAKRALQLLAKEIDRGSSIPALQGLLIFSARECACGRNSQGWLYSGMAFRMARDLGMHVAPKKLSPLSSQFSDEDLALRQQIFWSCYTWDKTMSLCFGRAPTIAATVELPTAETLPDGQDADEEIWQPVPPQGSLSESVVQQRALSSTRFTAYCELCIIVQGILDKLYSRPHRAERDHMLAYLTQTLEELDAWSSRLPADLIVPEGTKAVLCPPLHILLLNLLYHSTAILLCRPYRILSPTARSRCTNAAQMIDMLFTLHVRRFGFRCITWLQTYTMFVACTINVWDLRESRPQGQTTGSAELALEANARLEFGLEVLRQAGSTPSAERCATIIEQLLRTLSDGEIEARNRAERASHLTLDPNECRMASTSRRVDHRSPATQNAQSSLLIPPPAGISSNTLKQSVYHQHRSLDVSNNAGDASSYTYDGLPPLSTDFQRNEIETPLRWLPENVCDDGSWLLMDLDFDSWPMFNAVS